MVDKPDGTHSNPLYTKIASPETTGWAKDATLAALLEKASDNNSLLAEYIKKVAPELEKKTDEILNKTSKNLSDKIGESTKNNDDKAKQQQKANEEQQKKLEEIGIKYDKGIRSITSTIKAEDPLKNISEGLKGTLEDVGGKFGAVVGSMFGPAGTLVGKLTGSAIGSFIGTMPVRGLELSNIFRDMYDSGVGFNGSLNEMTKAAWDSSMTTEQMTALFKKHSETIAAIGTTNMIKFGKQLASITNDGAELGYTYRELMSANADYADLMLKSGQLQDKTVDELTVGSKLYLQELTGMSQLMGKSRQQLAQEQKEIAAQTKVRMGAQLLQSKEDKKRFMELSQITGPVGELLRRQFLALHGVPDAMTNSYRLLIARFNDSGKAIDDALMSTAEGEEFRNQSIIAGVKSFGEELNDKTLAYAATAESVRGVQKEAGELYAEGSLKVAAANEQAARLAKETGISFDDAIKKILSPKVEEGTQDLIKTRSQAEKLAAEAQTGFDRIAGTFTIAAATKIQETIDSMTNLKTPVENLGKAINDTIEKITGYTTGMSPVTTGVATGTATATTLYGGYKVAQSMGNRIAAARGAEVPGTGAKAAAEAAEAGIKGAAKEAMESSIAKAAATTAAEVGFKGIMKGIPFLGDVAEGLLAYEQSGSVGKGIAAGTGSLVGRAGAFAAGTATTGIGGIIAQGAGSLAGAQGGKMLYDYIFGGEPPKESKSDAQLQELHKMNQSLSGIHENIPSMIQRTPYGGPEDLISAGRFDSVSLMGSAGIKGAEAISPESARIIAATLTETTKTTAGTELGVGPTTAAEDPIKRKTTEFYDQSYLASNNMITLLKDIADKLDQLNQNVVDQTSDLDRSITSISGTLI